MPSQPIGLLVVSALTGLLIVAQSSAADDPRVALIVLGDPVLAEALDRELGARLRDAGFDVVDGQSALPPADATQSLDEIAPRFADRADLLVAVEIEGEVEAIALADLVEEMEAQGYILHWSDHIIVSNTGRRAVSHLQLVNYEGQTRIFTRRAAPGPAGRSRVA